MTKYYVLEIQKYQDGSFGQILHEVTDPDPTIARRKGESQYYTVLAAAALSNLPQHSAALIFQNGSCVMSKSYVNGGEE